MEEQKENEETLKEQIERIEKEQKQTIEDLKKELKEKDEVIKQFITTPSNKKEIENEDNDELFSDTDVKDILKLIKQKRS